MAEEQPTEVRLAAENPREGNPVDEMPVSEGVTEDAVAAIVVPTAQKLVLYDIPKFLNKKEVVKFLDRQNLPAYRSCKKIMSKPVATINFETEVDLLAAQSILDGLEWRGRKIRAKKDDGKRKGALSREDQGRLVKKRRLEGDESASAKCDKKCSTSHRRKWKHMDKRYFVGEWKERN